LTLIKTKAGSCKDLTIDTKGALDEDEGARPAPGAMKGGSAVLKVDLHPVTGRRITRLEGAIFVAAYIVYLSHTVVART
jgi:hypothetical protein